MIVHQLLMQLGFTTNTAPLNQFNSALNTARQQARSTADQLKGLLAAYVGFSAVKGALGFIVNTNREFERLNASLVTVTGSQEAANKAFATIEKFAAKTPFDLQQVVEAFTKLKALGLEPSEEALTAYGNTASSMGKPLMQMIEAVGDAATGEFERLKEFGIKASKQGDKVTFTFKGVKTTVKNDSKEIQKFLMKLGKTDFAGAMDRQSKTLNGMLSNIGDNFARLARKVGSSGLMAALNRAAADMMGMTSSGDGLAVMLGQKLGKAVEFVRAHFLDAAKAVEFVRAHFLDAAKAIGSVAAAFTLVKIGTFTQGIVQAAIAVLALGTAGLVAQAKLFLIPLAIGAAVVAIGLIADDIYRFATGGESVLGDLVKQFPALGKAVSAIGDFFVYAGPIVSDFWYALVEGARQAMAFWGPILSAFFTSVVGVIQTVLGGVLPVITQFFQSAANIVLGLVEFLTTVFINPRETVAAFGQFVMTVFQNLWPLIAAWVNNLITLFTVTWGTVIPAILNGLIAFWSGIWSTIFSIASGYISGIIQAIAGIPSAIAGAFGSLGQLAASVVGLGGPASTVTPGSSVAGRVPALAGGGTTNLGGVNVTVANGTGARQQGQAAGKAAADVFNKHRMMTNANPTGARR